MWYDLFVGVCILSILFFECVQCLCDSCDSILDVTIITTIIVVGVIVIAILVYPIIGWGSGRLCQHGAFPNQVQCTTTPIATEAPDGIHLTMGYTISPEGLKIQSPQLLLLVLKDCLGEHIF